MIITKPKDTECLEKRIKDLIENEDILHIVNCFIMGIYEQSFDYARLGYASKKCTDCDYVRCMNEDIFCTNQSLLRQFDNKENYQVDVV